MTATAIKIDNIGKEYTIGRAKSNYSTIRESISEILRKPFRDVSSTDGEKIWALKNVSFEVDEGEVLGIVGRNGSGKSTLLKILSRIVRPTRGRAVVSGRVGSLLEVGTGFHQELTGRENIFLNGAILGMKKAEIRRNFDAIVQFSEIEKFLDTPVKRYSSGMYVRLAFAVAAHLDPEILIVDEVLAVGDVAFQKKCLGKMDELSKSGRTVLFVSHNLGVINQLCDRAVWLDNGKLVKIGHTHEVIGKYLQSSVSNQHEGGWANDEKNSVDDKVRLTTAAVIDLNGNKSPIVNYGDDFYLEIEYEVMSYADAWSLLLRLKDDSGTPIFTSWDTDSVTNHKPMELGTHAVVCNVPGKFLRPGSYSVSLGTHFPRAATFNVKEDVFQFQISTVGYPMNLNRKGVLAPILKWIPRAHINLPE